MLAGLSRRPGQDWPFRRSALLILALSDGGGSSGRSPTYQVYLKIKREKEFEGKVNPHTGIFY